MAQGRLDQRLLRRLAKTAGAGASLALAVAALLLAGCGGGSSSSTSSTSASSGSPAEAGTTTSAQAESTAPAAKEVSGGQQAGGGQAARSGSSSTGTKHGPRVVIPKGEPEPGITPEQRRKAVVADMRMESPSSQPGPGGLSALSAQYTCDGKNTSPALRWQGVPEETAELALFAMNVQPVEGKLFFDWAVAGLSPELEEIKAGELPKGAVVGRNSFGKAGYEICPEGSGETYMFALYALPQKLSPEHGFEPLAFRKAVTGVSRNAGLTALSYSRG